MIASGDCRSLLRLCAGLAAVLLLGGCALGASPQRTAAAVSLDNKIAQMLMVGFRGTSLEDAPFILRDIRRRNLGGVILFDYDILQKRAGRNIASPDQLKTLVTSLKAAADTPLLVAVDQEGGRVARLAERSGFPPTVSHGELGEIDDLETTGRRSARLAATLAEMGIGLNLAPVVDLCVNPDNPVIAAYERCFSDDPEKVTAHARRFIRAHHEQGVLCTIKHFPGHGSSSADSHLGFTDVTGTWSRVELEPYRRLIRSGDADAVMTAHVFNARLDRRYPATLSRAAVTGILREELGFSGVVLSDDMQMRAITDHFGLETALEKAIAAGVDILVFGNNLAYDEKIVPRAVRIVGELVRSGRLSEERIDTSYRRILELKSRLVLKKGTAHK